MELSWKNLLGIKEIKLCFMLENVIFFYSPPSTPPTNSFMITKLHFFSNHLHDSRIQKCNEINITIIYAGVWTNLLTNLQIAILNPLGVLVAAVLSPAAFINNVLTFTLGKESQ